MRTHRQVRQAKVWDSGEPALSGQEPPPRAFSQALSSHLVPEQTSPLLRKRRASLTKHCCATSSNTNGSLVPPR